MRLFSQFKAHISPLLKYMSNNVTDKTTEQKQQALLEILRTAGSIAVAYSGGVDSAFLLRAAIEAIGSGEVLAVIGVSPSYPSREFSEAIRLADEIGARYQVINTEEMQDERYAANPGNRCYYCKHDLFTHILQLAAAEGYATVVDGNNADDTGDWRPGQQAARELGVRSPLIEVGMTKAEIRELSLAYGLPTWNKPASACLASRIPYNTPITSENLSMVERAENALRDLGFRHVRVRHHDSLARIEVPTEEISQLINPQQRERITQELRAIGYQYVTVDLQGYRTGSFNESLTALKASEID